jgi:hypothetical protein
MSRFPSVGGFYQMKASARHNVGFYTFYFFMTIT